MRRVCEFVPREWPTQKYRSCGPDRTISDETPLTKTLSRPDSADTPDDTTRGVRLCTISTICEWSRRRVTLDSNTESTNIPTPASMTTKAALAAESFRNLALPLEDQETVRQYTELHSVLLLIHPWIHHPLLRR